MVYLSSYRHDWKTFIVAWITYIYVWQRFERHFSHHRAKWIAFFPLYIVLTRELALDIFFVYFLPFFHLFAYLFIQVVQVETYFMTKNILFSTKFKKILCRKAEDMNLKAIYKSYKFLSIFCSRLQQAKF